MAWASEGHHARRGDPTGVKPVVFEMPEWLKRVSARGGEYKTSPLAAAARCLIRNSSQSDELGKPARQFDELEQPGSRFHSSRTSGIC